jgi:integrase
MTASTGKRRARGTGSIRLRRAPDVWELRAPTRDESGRAIQITKTAIGTRRDAERSLRELLGEIDSGRHRQGKRTVADLFGAWMDIVRTQRAPLTIKKYEANVRLHILPALGAIPLERLGPAEIDRLYVDLQTKKGLAPNTVHLTHSILHRGLDQGVRWGWLQSNPDDRTSPPPQHPTDLQPPTWEQIAELIAATEPHDPTMAMLIFLAALTGMRRGELAALRWSDVAAGSVVVSRGAVPLTGRGVVVGETKHRKIRTIGIAQHLEAALATHRTRMEKRAADAGTSLGPAAYVFSDRPGCSAPINPDEIGRRFAVARARVGHTYRLHDLRHFMGSWLVGRGVDVKTVSGRLGHASAKMTLDVYGHFSQALDSAAAAFTGELVLPPPQNGDGAA